MRKNVGLIPNALYGVAVVGGARELNFPLQPKWAIRNYYYYYFQFPEPIPLGGEFVQGKFAGGIYKAYHKNGGCKPAVRQALVIAGKAMFNAQEEVTIEHAAIHSAITDVLMQFELKTGVYVHI